MEEYSQQKKLFVGGIPWEATEDILKDHFSKYGEIVDCLIAKDRSSGFSRGFAFVSFSELSSVDHALQDSHQILSRTVEVKRAIPKVEEHEDKQQQMGLNKSTKVIGRGNENLRTSKIFVGGLSANITEVELKDYFEKFGRVKDAEVMYDNVTCRSRGFGFITYESEESVEEVVRKNFHELNGKLVEAKRAIPREGSIDYCNVFKRRLSGGGGGVCNFCQYQDYAPHSSPCVFIPGYKSLPGIAAHPYETGLRGVVYHSGGFRGICYGMAPVGIRTPWNSPSVVGTFGRPIPYCLYPLYVNGGVGLVSGRDNECNVTGGADVNGDGDALAKTDSKPHQIVEGQEDVKSLGSN